MGSINQLTREKLAQIVLRIMNETDDGILLSLKTEMIDYLANNGLFLVAGTSVQKPGARGATILCGNYDFTEPVAKLYVHNGSTPISLDGMSGVGPHYIGDERATGSAVYKIQSPETKLGRSPVAVPLDEIIFLLDSKDGKHPVRKQKIGVKRAAQELSDCPSTDYPDRLRIGLTNLVRGVPRTAFAYNPDIATPKQVYSAITHKKG